MGTSNSCLEMCANSSSRHQDKEQVLEALGIISQLKQLKKEQNLEDFLAGKLAIKRATVSR